jgi:AcrR family transcriptional regulator
MSRKIDLPAEQHVRAVLADMLAEAAEGSAKPSVLALARRLGLSNATYWRHFPDIAAEVNQTVSVAVVPASSEHPCLGRSEEQAAHIARLRRENARLTDQMEAAFGHLRQLTVDNAQLRRDLEAACAITRLDPGHAKSRHS